MVQVFDDADAFCARPAQQPDSEDGPHFTYMPDTLLPSADLGLYTGNRANTRVWQRIPSLRISSSDRHWLATMHGE
jgi:hypothetical protein